jgi:hypothetical protein
MKVSRHASLSIDSAAHTLSTTYQPSAIIKLQLPEVQSISYRILSSESHICDMQEVPTSSRLQRQIFRAYMYLPPIADGWVAEEEVAVDWFEHYTAHLDDIVEGYDQLPAPPAIQEQQTTPDALAWLPAGCAGSSSSITAPTASSTISASNSNTTTATASNTTPTSLHPIQLCR